MTHKLSLAYDENLIIELSSKFDLRQPNVEALKALVKHIEGGDYDPQVPLTLNLATGVGKTYVLAAFIEYLSRQGHKHVMVVTPGKVVQEKTVQDLSQGSSRYIGGFDVAPNIVTPQNIRPLQVSDRILVAGESPSTVFVFNVQQLFPPKSDDKSGTATGKEAERRKVYRFQEASGVLADRLIDQEDLVIIADESHLFGSQAKVFRSALTNLQPAVTVGLTASPDKNDDVVYTYPLWKAIQEEFVKQPVLVYRKSGYDSEEKQLQDAVSLLKFKEEQYAAYRGAHPDAKQTTPLLFVVCSDINHATQTATTLRNTYFPDTLRGPEVLQVDSKQHNDATTLTYLRNLDKPNSPIRCIVSVNKLREGWDTKRIAVMCTLRAMGSDVLTQQVMGRGLRLPFGNITGYSPIDQLDIISHKSFLDLLKNENVLHEFGIEEEMPHTPIITPPSDEHVLDNQESDDEEIKSRNDPSPNHPKEPVVRGVDDEEPITPDTPSQPTVVRINEEFKNVTFLFPTSIMKATHSSFSLLDLPTSEIKDIARQVTDSDEYLEKTLIATDADSKELIPKQLERQAVGSFHQSVTEVKKELTARIMRTQGVDTTEKNTKALLRNILPVFLEATGINDWTEKSKASACNILTTFIAKKAKQAAQNNLSVDIEIHPVKLPVATSYVLPPCHQIRKVLDGNAKSSKDAHFQQNQYYGPWSKGLFDAAAFDSFAAEYKLADLLNFDPQVEWWTRIYPKCGAHIAWSPRNDYIPDFVVKDATGTYWIVEAKAENKRDDEEVAKKRTATERVLRELVTLPDYENQSWGYLLAFEKDIEHADSLKELISRCEAERMPQQ